MATKKEMIVEAIGKGIEVVLDVDLKTPGAHRRLTVKQLEVALANAAQTDQGGPDPDSDDDGIGGPPSASAQGPTEELPGEASPSAEMAAEAPPPTEEVPQTPAEPEHVRDPASAVTGTEEMFDLFPQAVLAQRIYDEVVRLQSAPVAWGKIGDYSRRTLLGAKALCGQCLGVEDAKGRVTVGRFVRVKDIFNQKLLFASPLVSEHEKVPVNPQAVMIPTDAEVADEGIELFGLPEDLREDIQKVYEPDIRMFLAGIYDDIRRVRGTALWMRYLYDFHRKVLQGVQITAAQLLGFRDKRAPITLRRYLQQGATDARVFNALGYYKAPAENRIL